MRPSGMFGGGGGSLLGMPLRASSTSLSVWLTLPSASSAVRDAGCPRSLLKYSVSRCPRVNGVCGATTRPAARPQQHPPQPRCRSSTSSRPARSPGPWSGFCARRRVPAYEPVDRRCGRRPQQYHPGNHDHHADAALAVVGVPTRPAARPRRPRRPAGRLRRPHGPGGDPGGPEGHSTRPARSRRTTRSRGAALVAVAPPGDGRNCRN